MAGLQRCGRGLFCSFLDLHPVSPHRGKKNLTFYGQFILLFLGGPQHFDEGVARISRTDRIPPFPGPPPPPRSRLYFLACYT